MKIEEGNANKTFGINKRFSISLILALTIFMISGSTVTMSYAAPQTLPTCVDPTGQNIPCVMFISTLTPPKHTLQCQESSGQIFKCTYIIDKLSNGNRIVALTVYVPANFVVSGTESFRVVKVRVTVSVRTTYSCQPGYHDVVIAGIHQCIPNPPPPPCNVPHMSHVLVLCPPPTKPTCDSKYYTGPCPPTDPNALTKCISAALVANDNKGVLGCATLLPDTHENALTKCISAGLLANDNIAVLKCAKLLPSTNGASNNMTNTTTSAAIQPSNTSIPASGGKGTVPTCVNNCTTGTPSPADCTKNPTDPSCTQTLTPPPTATTKTCPDGSVIDASATCPTNTPPSTPPPTSSPPPSTGSQGSPDNNPSPPSNSVPPPSSSGGDNGGGGSSSGGGGSGNSNSGGSSSGGGGSSPP
ncbi:MAG: hypothetical protein M3P08_14440 [Thermoproteota archaeon]|nr:hypothetical protein [Thermoproteota archaeon]